MESEIQEVTLSYIERVHTSLLEIGKTINNTMILQTVLSFLMVSIVTNVVSVDKELSLGGLKFSLLSWFTLSGGALLISCLYIYFLGLISHEERLRDTMIRLYQSLNFRDPSLLDKESNPLEYPNLVTVAFSSAGSPKSLLGKGFYNTLQLLVMFLIFVFPLIAQGFTLFKILAIFNYVWWVWVLVTVLFIVTIGYLVTWINNSLGFSANRATSYNI